MGIILNVHQPTHWAAEARSKFMKLQLNIIGKQSCEYLSEVCVCFFIVLTESPMGAGVGGHECRSTSSGWEYAQEYLEAEAATHPIQTEYLLIKTH